MNNFTLHTQNTDNKDEDFSPAVVVYHLKYEHTPETAVWELPGKWKPSGKKNREGKEKGNMFIQRCVEEKKNFWVRDTLIEHRGQ